MNTLKVNVCFLCKEYIVIHPDNPNSKILVSRFDVMHSGHPKQVINHSEITEEYKNVGKKIKNL